MKNLELKNKDKTKEILDTAKIIKARDNRKILNEYLPLLHSEKTQGVTECNNKRCKICNYRR